jgi:hypothetical protein
MHYVCFDQGVGRELSVQQLVIAVIAHFCNKT